MRTLRDMPRTGALCSILAALSGAMTFGVGARSAAAGEGSGVHVHVHAPSGRGCIDAARLEAAVKRHVRGAPKKDAVDVRIEALDPAGYQADISIAGRGGKRTVRTNGGACSKLDDGIVLVVTMLVDPDEPPPSPPKADLDPDADDTNADPKPKGSTWGDEEPSDEPQAPPNKGALDKESPDKDSPDKDSPDKGSPDKVSCDKASPGKASSDKASPDKASPDKASPDKASPDKASLENGGGAPPERTHKVQFGVGFNAVFATGMAPAPLPGARLSFSWLGPGPVSIEGSFSYFSKTQQYGYSGVASYLREVETWSAELDVCPAKLDSGRLHFGACAGVALTRLRHRTDTLELNMDFPDPYLGGINDVYLVSPAADLRFDVQIVRALRAGVGLGMMVPFEVQNDASYVGPAPSYDVFGPLHQDVIFQGRAGITVVLPP